MSKYEEMRTVLTEECHLVGALRDLGYEPEVHGAEGAALVGYMGDERSERAHHHRRHQLDSASNDIGFVRDGATGVYRAIISEYDRGIEYNEVWLGRIAQGYKERQTMAVAKAKGYVFRGREIVETPQGKRVQLRFAVR